MSTITATLPGLVLSNEHYGEGLSLQKITGWYNTVGPRIENDARPDSDGDFGQDPVYLNARFITISGGASYSSNPDTLFDAQRVVTALGSLRGYFPLEIEDPSGIRTALVKVAERIDFDFLSGEGEADFEIVLKADDPHRYWPTIEADPTGPPTAGSGIEEPIVSPIVAGAPGRSGRITLTNPGNADTYPTLTVTGGLTLGFELVAIETGGVIRLDRFVPVGTSIAVDVAAGQVWIDNQSPVVTSRADWTKFRIPAGGSLTVQFNALGSQLGSPLLSATYAPSDN